jgi:SAM-dependent methyltransferase
MKKDKAITKPKLAEKSPKTGGRPMVWNKLKADWYKKGLIHSSAPTSILSVVLARASGINSFLDVGAGCGTLAIPLAKAGKVVSVIEPSPHMVKLLEEDAKKQGLEINCITAAWEEVAESAVVEGHDAIICANVPGLLKDGESFLRRADQLAKKAVFLITGADPQADKFYYKELFPLIFDREFSAREDYLKTYKTLHSIGIFANVEIIEYDFDQPFDNIEEATQFWKEYMGIVTEEHDEKLRVFLTSKLKKTDDGLLAEFHKKSAVIWWNK